MIAALILAGGQATRMGGGDKALLELAPGHTLLDEMFRRLRPQARAIAISANGDAARFARFACPVLADGAGTGPLAGVLAGLEWAEASGAKTLLTVPADTPFIPADLAARLAPAPAYAVNAAGIHPLTALWPVACRPALCAYVARATRVKTFAIQNGMLPVSFAEDPDPFLNINTPEDLALGRHRLRKLKTEN